MWTALQRTVALATIIATTTATGALAQATAADPNSTEMDAMETAPSEGAGGATDQAQDAQPEQPSMMSEPMDQGTMGSGMMSQGMMCSEMCAGMMDQGGMDQRRTDDSARDQGRPGPGMQGHGGMGPRTTSGPMHPGMMGVEMHEQMMKIVFALADADGNGGLSLDELATIQTRIFAAVDADANGNMTPEELEAFIRE